MAYPTHAIAESDTARLKTQAISGSRRPTTAEIPRGPGVPRVPVELAHVQVNLGEAPPASR